MAYDTEVLADSPTHYWRLAETSGTDVYDEITATNNLTYSSSGVTLNQAGWLSTNPSVEFQSVSGTATGAISYPISTTGTIEFAIMTPSGGGAGETRVLSASDTINGTPRICVYVVSGQIWLIVTDGGSLNNVVYTTFPDVADTWYHVAITANSTYSFYIDKVLQTTVVDTGADDGAWSSSTGAMSNIWLHENGAPITEEYSFRNQRIDEVAVYNTALSGVRIAAHYDARYTSIPVEEALADNLTMSDVQAVEYSVLRSLVEAVDVASTHVLSYDLNHFAIEAITLADQTGIKWNFVLTEGIGVEGAPLSTGTFNILSTEAISLAETMFPAYEYMLSEGLEVSETYSAAMYILRTIIESLSLSETSPSLLTINIIGVEGISFTDSLFRFFENILSEDMTLAETLSNSAKLSESFIEDIDSSESLSKVFSLAFPLDETIGTADTAVINQAVIERLAESFKVGELTLRIGDSTYSGWVINPETFTIWNYSNYNFNSMTEADGSYYGANSSGLYLLEGVKDDGDYITGRFQMASMDFGTSNLKQMSNIYLGVTVDGSVVLKVSVDNRSTNYYELIPSQENFHTYKGKIGKGLVGRYFQFEIETKDTTEFELDSIEFLPVVFKRKF